VPDEAIDGLRHSRPGDLLNSLLRAIGVVEMKPNAGVVSTNNAIAEVMARISRRVADYVARRLGKPIGTGQGHRYSGPSNLPSDCPDLTHGSCKIELKGPVANHRNVAPSIRKA
jgi:hypothetical protein